MVASPATLQRGDDGIYRAHWTEGRRSRRVSMRTRDLARAQINFGKWLVGRGVRDGASDATVADAWDRYRAARPNSETASAAWDRLAEHFGDERVADVDQDVVDAYIDARAAGEYGPNGPVTASTIAKELGVLRAILNRAARGRAPLVRHADLHQWDKIKVARHEGRWLNDAELAKLFRAATRRRDGGAIQPLEVFLRLALHTGARKGAIRDLTWAHVDFDAGLVRYSQTRTVETAKRRVDVAMSTALRRFLRRARDEAEARPVFSPAQPVLHGGPKDMYPLVRGLARVAGLGDDVGPHCLRRTAAVQMARAGVDMWKIAGVLGNTVSVAEKRYAHFAPGAAAASVEAIRVPGE